MQTSVAEPSTSSSTPPAAADPRAGKYLMFLLGNEEFGVSVAQALEILGMPAITAVPNTPEHIKGVINLRGKIIPIVDLRLKFNLTPDSDTRNTCVVVVRVQRGEDKIQVGMVVDRVLEVANLQSSEIDDAPDFGESLVTPWLLGIARKKEGVRILLHVDRVLSAKELEGVEEFIQP